ncbi:ABC transporter ATP-binding protein [Thermovenabulum gondwanense]|uniref:Putative ABC transporter ATP-binding protein n=1 Tax=Thermovenabulum gondwanense TaxID=520767 RepID=A0A161PW46_9FIRM|nr:ABC transporter ATP-binding protein [Thermovenabulum gondwanense]KYO67351.1 putative ABC transporter ATP-binding protein [Thermovenabulum gondwanense]
MKKFLKFLKPYRTYIFVSLGLVFLQALSELYLPDLMSDIVNYGIVNGDIGYILRKGELMILIALGGTFAAVVSSYLSAQSSMGFGKMLREEIFTKVENFSLYEFNKFGTASLITRTTNDVNQLQIAVLMGLRMVARAPLMAVGSIVMTVSKDTRLSLIVFVSVFVVLSLVYIFYKTATPIFRAIQKKIDRVNLILRENLTGIRVIRAFNKIDYEKRRFDVANRDLTETSMKVNRLVSGLMPLIMLISNLTFIALIWFGGIRIDRGQMQVGDLMAIIQYVMQIMFSIVMLSMIFVMLPRASASALRIQEVLDEPFKIKDPEKVEEIKDVKGVIEFKNVTFRYPGAEEPVLYDVSFKAEPGKVTAIIGSTGAGKSTILNLILRFYDINEGSILVDGVDIRNLKQENLRSIIGYVPQKALLFSGTVAENIRFGSKNVTDEDIKRAADIAQATEFVSSMMNGFNSEVSQGGVNLSGGQKQRLAIARAVAKKARIYLFDDCFSALDFKTDLKVRTALKKEIKDATVIIVAQRAATIMNADQIIVLHEGKVVGIGTHNELMKYCDVYKDIVSSQISEEELA